MSRLIKSVFISFVFCLTSCGGLRNFNEFKSGARAIIITQQSTVRSVNKYISPFFDTSWVNERTGNILNMPDSPASWKSNRFKVYCVEPGTYSLVSISGYFENKTEDGKEDGSQEKTANNLSDLVLFSVKAGEVVYIGDLVIKDLRGAIVPLILNIIDEYGEAKKFLATKYPEIDEVPTKRLMVFSKRAQALRNQFGIK